MKLFDSATMFLLKRKIGGRLAFWNADCGAKE